MLAITILSVKFFEKIEYEKPKERKLIGQRCLVVKKIMPGERGVVKVYREDGRLDPELWSAESKLAIGENQTARVVGTRSIILLLEPD